MKIDLVKQLINEFENSEVFKMKVEIDTGPVYKIRIRKNTNSACKCSKYSYYNSSNKYRDCK